MAEWIEDDKKWFTPGGDSVWICSNCGGGRHVFGIESTESQPKICPDCGEKMTNAIEVVWLDDVTRTWRRVSENTENQIREYIQKQKQK